jgi:hypothetical protein
MLISCLNIPLNAVSILKQIGSSKGKKIKNYHGREITL